MIRHDPATVRAIEPRYREIYTHAVETRPAGGRQLYVSGQVGIRPSGEVEATFGDQCRRALENVEALLTAAGMSTEHIVKATYFLTRREDLPELAAIRAERWGGVRPAVTTLVVSALAAPELLVEVEVIAQEEAG